MRISDCLLRQIEADLGLNVRYEKGREIPVRNCWHFCSDGDSVECLFNDRQEFEDGMNRVYTVSKQYGIVILAFVLMDTHVHFILYGDFDKCNRFMHEYIRRTSMYLFQRHGKRHSLSDIRLTHQCIDDDMYLKTAICYVLKNPPVGGLQYTYYDYPWSSGPLMFRSSGYWSTPLFLSVAENASPAKMSGRKTAKLMKSHTSCEADTVMIDNIVYPGTYVAVEIAERIFMTHKSFCYFMGKTKSSDVESRAGVLSHLTVPIYEMRQHKYELCMELFGQQTLKNLSVNDRLKIAKILKSRYNSSPKQIAKLCGLVYSEVKDMF